MAGTARQVHLGRQLRELRSRAGLSLEQAAAHVERVRATVGHWERGHARISARDLDALLTLYGAQEEISEHLRQLRRDCGQRGWWQSYKLPPYLEPFVGFEAEASEIFNFELGVVPGLLQTREYTWAVHEAGHLALSEPELEAWAEFRMQRQKRLDGDDLTLHAVIAEEALHRVVGSRRVMAEQLRHLADSALRPNVKLQVLPLESGAHVGVSGPIVVLRFADPAHVDVAFSDTPLGGTVIDEIHFVAELSRLFGHLQRQALSITDSMRLLSTIAEDHMIKSKEQSE